MITIGVIELARQWHPTMPHLVEKRVPETEDNVEELYAWLKANSHDNQNFHGTLMHSVYIGNYFECIVAFVHETDAAVFALGFEG